MVGNLPTLYRKDPWILALAAALGLVLDGLGSDIRSLSEQMSLDTVSWNLAVEERLAGIKPPSGATLEQRRAALKAKWRAGGKATLAQIQAVAESWSSRRVEASFLAGVILLDILNLTEGTVEDIRAAVELIKPAHLPLKIIERQYTATPIYMGTLPRQGDKIIWEVDCSGAAGA